MLFRNNAFDDNNGRGLWKVCILKFFTLSINAVFHNLRVRHYWAWSMKNLFTNQNSVM